MREIDKLYKKYEYLAGIYSSKVFNLQSISYEKEDIKQDFKLKLFSAIVTYVRQFDLFLQGKRYRPMPLEVYLKLAMSNFLKDVIKKMNTSKFNNWHSYTSIEREDFDFSIFTENQNEEIVDEIVNFKISSYRDDLTLPINGVDILHGLEQKEHRIAFILFLRGYKLKVIDKLMNMKTGKAVKEHIENLKNHKQELMEFNSEKILHFVSEES